MISSECREYGILADGSKLCNHCESTTHCICENIVKFGECPKEKKKEG